MYKTDKTVCRIQILLVGILLSGFVKAVFPQTFTDPAKWVDPFIGCG
jgi:hypothetical protein